jgi:hypothetical protein
MFDWLAVGMVAAMVVLAFYELFQDIGDKTNGLSDYFHED